MPALHDISPHPRTRDAIRQRLLSWYDTSHRDLPWRRSTDPYHILLSEFLLQQTQVASVIPYYHRFLERFPTLADLAAAPQSDVLKAWEGLGYYARARNLHRTADAIVNQYGGTIPRDYETLASLPGFGPYTTAAVLSIAFHQDYAVVDGNVIRVLTRLFDIIDDTGIPNTRKGLQELAQGLLPAGRADAYNQAIMELGALVCTPSSPSCTSCPVGPVCRGRRAATVDVRPVKSRKAGAPHHTCSVALVWHHGKVLIARRPQTGLLAGLWEFPSARQMTDETLKEACKRASRETAGVEAAIASRFCTVKHAYSHFRVTMHAFQCTYGSGRAKALGCDAIRWVSPGQLDEYAFSRANRKIIERLLEPDADSLVLQVT